MTQLTAVCSGCQRVREWCNCPKPSAEKKRSAENNNSKCKSCSSPISWIRTKNNALMPVDGHGHTGIFSRTKHSSHWDTCPNASYHRTGKSEEGHIFTTFEPMAVIDGVKIFSHKWGTGGYRFWFKKPIGNGSNVPYDGTFSSIEKGLAWAQKCLED